MQETAITVLLTLIALLNGWFVIGQANQRADFKQMTEKLDHWIQEFIKMKAQHDMKYPDCNGH